MTISTDTKCRELLERLRWPDGIACPRCGSKGISSVHKRPVYDCNDCRHQFSVGCVRSQTTRRSETTYALIDSL